MPEPVWTRRGLPGLLAVIFVLCGFRLAGDRLTATDMAAITVFAVLGPASLTLGAVEAYRDCRGRRNGP